MAISKKTEIIEAIFNKRWDPDAKSLSDSRVTLDQVRDAIRDYNKRHPEQSKPLSDKNPANFYKDFIRNKTNANRNWPRSLLKRGYTARQITGEEMCFEFVPIEEGQKLPFPIRIYSPTATTTKRQIQSVSMPLASRQLGRRDEAWLIQVLARLHVIETHLSLSGPQRIVQVELLQTNIKQSRTEIDALFLAVEEIDNGAQMREVIVSCEAKGLRDDILEDQIIAQVKAVFKMKGIGQNIVIPLAAKVVGPSQIYIIQFKAVSRKDSIELEFLDIECDSIYELAPEVPGIR